jgi:hypothetical protein
MCSIKSKGLIGMVFREWKRFTHLIDISTDTERVFGRREAEEPYQEIQKHIILGRLDKAISEFASHLGDLDEQLGPA